MSTYYYTDAEELEALRRENQALKQEIEKLKSQIKGGSQNGKSKK